MKKAFSTLADKIKSTTKKDGEDQQSQPSPSTERRSLDTARTKNTGISGRPEASSPAMGALLKANESMWMGVRDDKRKKQIEGYEERKPTEMSAKDEATMQKLKELEKQTPEERERNWQARFDEQEH